MRRGLGSGFARVFGFLGLRDLGFAGKWVGVSTLIGLAGGLAAFGFQRLVHLAQSFLERLTHVHAEGVAELGGSAWTLLLALPAGGLAAGLLVWRFAPEAGGHGTEHLVRSFHELGGRVRARVVWLKALTSAITIGSGGSAGQEGPVAQIGSGVGSLISDALRLSTRDRRLFLLAGSSAGIGALFTAPLGAALLAPEVLYRKPELEGEAIVPCIISSIVAYTTFRALSGQKKAIVIPDEVLATLALHDPRELALYLVLALLCTLVSWLYVRVFDGVRERFQRLSRVPIWARPALGGLFVALLAIALARWPATGTSGVLFGGYGLMKSSILGELPLLALAGLAGAKILATSLSIGSGGSGGVFAPSLAVGALLGAIVGQGAAQLFPDLGLHPACYALVGMGGFFAGLAKTPIAAILIVCEMTGSYELLAPLMLVSAVHLLLSKEWTIYGTQVPGIVDSPAHAGDFVVDVLEQLDVADLLGEARAPELVPETATLRSALDIVSRASGYYFPVVDEEQRMVGIFSLSDVRRIFQQLEVADMVIVRDFMVDRVVTTTPEESLSDALHKLNEHGLHEIPVVEADDPTRVRAMLTRQSLGAAYHARLEALRGPALADGLRSSRGARIEGRERPPRG